MPEIIKIEKIKYPAIRFIGRKYLNTGNWGEWWEMNLFAPLEKLGPMAENEDSYIGAMRVVDGQLEYWIGMFMPIGTEVPEGYEAVDIPEKDYVLFYHLYGNENNGELYGIERHNQCLGVLKENGWVRSEDDWCFEKYNCPRFTNPDEKGNVILDYVISIQ